MDELSTISDAVAIGGTLAALLVAFYAIRGYRLAHSGFQIAEKAYLERNVEAELKRRQHEYFTRVSAEILLIYEALLTFNFCKKNAVDLDEYLFPVYQHNVLQLHQILNKSARHELTHILVEPLAHPWTSHLAFRSALLSQGDLDLEAIVESAQSIEELLDPVFSSHMLLGLDALTKVCIAHNGNPLERDLSKTLKLVHEELAESYRIAHNQVGQLWEFKSEESRTESG